MTSDLQGQVEKVTFFNEDNGFTIAKVRVAGRPEPATVVGPLLGPSPGEVLRMQGVWVRHPRFGEQFEVETYQVVQPTTVEGVEKYLGSGLIKGLGPEMARRIVARFGAEALEVIDRAPKRLREVEGIGPKRLAMIQAAWQGQRQIREVMLFLQAHGVSTAYAIRILKEYGPRSIQVLRENPYRLAADIHGIGFVTADRIAGKLGLSRDDPLRVEAGVEFVLSRLSEQGHVYYPQDRLAATCERLLQVNPAEVETALVSVSAAGRVVVEELDGSGGGERAVYLSALHAAESGVADRLKALLTSARAIRAIDPKRAMAWVQERLGLVLSQSQEQAVLAAAEHKVLVITGGPGTGKTTLIHAILRIFQRIGVPVLLAAPTGRAAKRLSETTGREAKTLHRLLEFNPKAGSFRRNERRPLAGEALVVDEFSMVDLVLLYHLLRAVPAWMRLVFVGDKDQLPSVGPGSLLRDIIASERVSVSRLDEIFRQEKDSLIVLNAHRINQGQSLIYPPYGDKDADFYFLRQESDEGVFKTIVTLACYSVPRKLGLPALSADIQVISPMYRGLAGVDHLNEELQKRLNPSREGLRAGAREFRINDKVMQIRNDYEKEVFNGDIGLVCGMDRARYRLFVDFYGRQVCYEKEEMGDLTLAYAISVHKAQGSEYQAVIMPLLTQHFIMLQRNLFYTALTRAKKLSMIVGSAKALHIAIKNDKPVKRNSLIRAKLSLTARSVILP